MSTEAAFRAFLDQAHTALNSREAQEAERQAKAISALVRAERDVAEYLSELTATHELDDEDTLRTELQRRLALFAETDLAGHSAEVLARVAETGVAA